MDTTFDVIVLGLGAMGSAATYQLAKRGTRVLGIEMLRPGHDQGSSHGEHRMIRNSSFQADGYVPLADRAFALWRELEAEANQRLLQTTGEVWLLHEDGNPGYRAGVQDSLASGFRVILSDAELAEQPVSKKLRWRVETSASRAKESWLRRHRSRHLRRRSPTGCVGGAITIVAVMPRP